jgi:hypothetical protein
LAAPVPAQEQIGQVLAHMAQHGWTAQGEDALNPGIPTSTVRGWTSYIDARHPSRTRRYVWTGEWRNAQGDLASYVFSYVIPENGAEALSRMQVYSNVVEAEAERQIEAQVKRQTGRQGSPPRPEGLLEGPVRTGLDARAGDCFLASNPLGDAIVQVTGADGALVSYRWRARSASDGATTSGSAPASSTIQAGPLSLSWMPRAEGQTLGAVGYYAGQMDLIPLPAAEFEIDLAAVRRLAALTPERDERYRRFVLPPEQTAHDRTTALVFSGKTTPVHSGQAFLVGGGQGRGVVVIEKADLRSIRYRWRYRAPSSGADTAGTAENADTPYPSIRVGPYAMLWQMTSQSGYREGNGPVQRDWSAEIRYLAEELTVTAIPEAEAASVDLARH